MFTIYLSRYDCHIFYSPRSISLRPKQLFQSICPLLMARRFNRYRSTLLARSIFISFNTVRYRAYIEGERRHNRKIGKVKSCINDIVQYRKSTWDQNKGTKTIHFWKIIRYIYIYSRLITVSNILIREHVSPRDNYLNYNLKSESKLRDENFYIAFQLFSRASIPARLRYTAPPSPAVSSCRRSRRGENRSVYVQCCYVCPLPASRKYRRPLMR